MDILQRFPGLAAYEKQAVRLRPCREKPAGLTGFGIAPLWPENEGWPVCHGKVYGEGAERPHTEQYVPVLQVYAGDLPHFPMPAGRDLFQLLWCPETHTDYSYGPRCRVYWRSREKTAPGTPVPQPVAPNGNYLVRSCSVRPVTVREYPSPFELESLDAGLYEAIMAWEAEQGEPAYQYGYSAADGCKAGGFVNWLQDPEVPICSCGRGMEHLLTISETEFDGGTAPWWGPGADVFTLPYRDREPLQWPLGIHLGDMGKLYLFVCKACAHWPVETVFQCG